MKDEFYGVLLYALVVISTAFGLLLGLLIGVINNWL